MSCALPDLLGHPDTVRVTNLATESGRTSSAATGLVYEGAAEVHDRPKSLRATELGDASRDANALVYLEDPAVVAPDGALVEWLSDARGRQPRVAGVVLGVRRADGAHLVRFP